LADTALTITCGVLLIVIASAIVYYTAASG
jgi:hypothetical protein